MRIWVSAWVAAGLVACNTAVIRAPGDTNAGDLAGSDAAVDPGADGSLLGDRISGDSFQGDAVAGDVETEGGTRPTATASWVRPAG